LSQNTHDKLKDIKLFIENNEYENAQNIIESISRDKLNGLERDIIDYFQANIYLLEGKDSLAMLTFATLVNSKNIDSEMFLDVKHQLLKIHFKRNEYNLALQYLDENQNDFQSNIIRYFAYKQMGMIEESYNFLEKEIFSSDDIILWKDYLDFRIELKKKDILNISGLLQEIDNIDEVQKFSRIFIKRNLFVEAVRVYEKGFQLGLLPIQEKISFVKLAKKLNDPIYFENLLKRILVGNPYDYFKLEYGKHLFNIGEFEEAKKVLYSVKSGKKYILLGNIFEANGDLKNAKNEWEKALSHFESVIEAREKLKRFE
jgi:hypothetical protein